MNWNYSAKRHRWKATSHGWRAIAQRARNGLDWEAAIEQLDGGARLVSAVVFRTSDAAREWCEDAITRLRLGLTERSHPTHRPSAPAGAIRWIAGSTWEGAGVGVGPEEHARFSTSSQSSP